MVKCAPSIEGILKELMEGVAVSNGIVRVEEVKVLPGSRLHYPIIFEVGGSKEEVCLALAFCGRGYYRPWIEVYSCNPVLGVGGRSFRLVGSSVEESLLDLLARHMGPGEPLYFEYVWDEETLREASQGVHPAFTRLGWLLLRRGFTWFKLWYYPEGFMEGAEKIQAEKPINAERMRVHLEELRREAERLAREGRGKPSLRAKEFLAWHSV